LIDEPEISLHVAWQKEFLKDLQEIIKIQNMPVVIATHSPRLLMVVGT
jgi:predicted ATP-dependent endonuclease of OLD family